MKRCVKCLMYLCLIWDLTVEWWSIIGYTKLKNQILESDKTEEQKQKLLKFLNSKYFIKYDMSKVHILDVQAIVYLVDTNIKYPSLKSSEEWYLRMERRYFWRNFTDGAENFYYLTPEEAYRYAATDALGTLLLGFKLLNYYKEARDSR